jgi:hypothetical protein
MTGLKKRHYSCSYFLTLKNEKESSHNAEGGDDTGRAV